MTRTSLAATAFFLILASVAARAQDAPAPAPTPPPPPPATSRGAEAAPDGAPEITRPATAAPAGESKDTPSDAKALDDDGAPLGLWYGSRPDIRVQGGLELFVADFKSRSHFGFREHTGRGEETAFVEDAGWPTTVLIEGATVRLNLGVPGWVGADFQGFAVANQRGQLDRERQTNSVLFEPGDELHSHGEIYWGRLYYGYELGYRFVPGGIPITFALSPYLGVGMIDETVRLRRVAPSTTSELGGHITAFNIAPGLRGYVDFFDHVKLGFDIGIPGAFPLTTPKIHTSDRYLVFVGLHAFHVELDLGWKEIGNHLLGIEDATDMRFRGFDFQLKVEF